MNLVMQILLQYGETNEFDSTFNMLIQGFILLLFLDVYRGLHGVDPFRFYKCNTQARDVLSKSTV